MKKKKVTKKRLNPRPPFLRRTLLESLTAAVGAYYSKDPTRAGVVLSDLGNDVWYCSVVRYNGRMGEEKKLVCSAKQPNLAQAIQACAAQFEEIVRTPHRLLVDLERTLKAMDVGSR